MEAAKPAFVSPTPASPTPAKPAVDGGSVKERVLALVAEKTGYPVDMLDLDLDLEADLGIDTVKQAEVMATIREAYGIVRDDTIKLRDFPTLARVIQFVHDRKPDLRGPHPVQVTEVTPVPAPLVKPAMKEETTGVAPVPAVAPAKNGDPVKERILALMVEKTGYPQDMLDLDLDLEADLGVDTVKQAEMFAAIREIYSIPRDENRKLRDYPTLAHVIRFVYEKRPDLASKPAPVASPPVSPSPLATSATTTEPLLPSVPVVAQDSSDDPIKKKVLQIVAEKTGYPEDMLDLDLDLEADLGVDTVKQAEMFAAVRAAYSIPRDENMKLRDFPTLAHVIKFAHDRSAPLAAVPAISVKAERAEPKPAASSPSSTRPVFASFDAANRIPRRVPVPTLRPPLMFFKATGVKLDNHSRVVVMPDKGGAGDALTKSLRAKGVEVLHIEGAPDAEALQSLLKNWTAAGPVDGVYWLPALDNEGDLREPRPRHLA